MSNKPEIVSLLGSDTNLKDLLDLINPKSNLLLADEVMLSDSEGNVIWVSENYEKSFGFEHGSMVGMSAYDLESNGIFKPSITLEVIRTRKKVEARQTINNTHKNVITVGIPLFDNSGTLKYVACFNTFSLEQIKTINNKYRELQESLINYEQELSDLRAKAKGDDLIIRSKPMLELWNGVKSYAGTNANVLITGETGVGKSKIARVIHEMSDRKSGPFIEVNCAVLNENLIESELFGYEKGAFTGAASTGKIGRIELANNGTLFLDEIGELPIHVQSKLLEIIQNKTMERISGNKKIEVDFRLIVATNKDLEQEVSLKNFRSDLYYRLNVLRLHIPPLRERVEDIVPMAESFLNTFCERYKRELTFSPRTLSAFESYEWPGNIRELENLIERYVITATYPVIDIPFLNITKDEHKVSAHIGEGSLDERLEILEGTIIKEAYTRLGSTVKVAEELGISQPTAARKIAKYCK